MTGQQSVRRERRGLLVLVLATFIPFALLAVWARFFSPASWELGLLSALAARDDNLGALTGAINSFGNLPVWAIAVAIAAAIVAALRGIVAALLVALSFAADLAAFGVKLLVERQRPETAAAEHLLGPDSFAYPSGHTVRAVALVAVTIWVLAPVRTRLPLAIAGGLIAGLLMGYARVSLNVHWPTDTLGGTLLGIGWFGLSAIVATRALDRGMRLQRRPGPRA